MEVALSKLLGSVCGVLALTVAMPAAAQDETGDPPPEIFAKVLECRALASDAARLSCYDGAVAAMETARQNEDLIVASREEVREARRGLFGLSLPKIKLFGGGDDDGEEEIKRIESTIKSFSRGRSGYVFVLEDGAVWYMTEGDYINRPENGEPIEIERGAFGSFFARVDGGKSVRVKRRD